MSSCRPTDAGKYPVVIALRALGKACGSGLPKRIYDVVDQTYQRGSKNTVHTGPKYPSYLQLPVIPDRK